MTWDPDQYLRFEAERALAFHHLVAAIANTAPSFVVDLGCGSGGLTATLLRRWPAAKILGIDSSQEMIKRARHHAVAGRLRFEVGDIVQWSASEPVDVMVANACLQWIGDHHSLFDHLLPQLSEKGVLAWVLGTTLRPILERLPESYHLAFLAQYGALLRDAYPPRDGRTTFPFTRTFVVAVKI